MAKNPQNVRNKAMAMPASVPKDQSSFQGNAESVLDRIADALERLAPPPPATPDFLAAEAFVWHPEGRRLAPVARVNRVEMSLLKGIDRVRALVRIDIADERDLLQQTLQRRRVIHQAKQVL